MSNRVAYYKTIVPIDYEWGGPNLPPDEDDYLEEKDRFRMAREEEDEIRFNNEFGGGI